VSQVIVILDAMKKLVTTIMPVFNRQDIVLQALESVLRQHHRPIELICVDDGSTDGSLSQLQDFAKRNSSHDFRVLVLTQANAGVSAARNNGLRIATGEYVQFLDSDDLYHPVKTTACLSVAEKMQAEVVVPCCRGFQASEVEPILMGAVNEIPSVDFSTHDRVKTEFLWGPNSPFIKRDLVEREGGFKDDLRYAEDREFFIRIRLRSCRTIRLRERLTFFRRGDYGRLTGPPASRAAHLFRLRQQSLELTRTTKTAARSSGVSRVDLVYLLMMLYKLMKKCIKQGDPISLFRLLRVYPICLYRLIRPNASLPAQSEGWWHESVFALSTRQHSEDVRDQ
jgi:glycosyltransferase involved in cell wall biosynthesis